MIQVAGRSFDTGANISIVFLRQTYKRLNDLRFCRRKILSVTRLHKIKVNFISEFCMTRLFQVPL